MLDRELEFLQLKKDIVRMVGSRDTKFRINRNDMKFIESLMTKLQKLLQYFMDLNTPMGSGRVPCGLWQNPSLCH